MSQRLMRNSATSSFRKYLIDCGTIKRKLGRLEDAFYFYPNGLDGFIESCVLATQRDIDDEGTRDMMILRDLKTAMGVWKDRLDEDYYRKGRELFPVRDHAEQQAEIENALRLGAKVDDFILGKMRVIRDVHGDFSLDPSTFEWPNKHSLIVPVYY